MALFDLIVVVIGLYLLVEFGRLRRQVDGQERRLDGIEIERNRIARDSAPRPTGSRGCMRRCSPECGSTRAIT